MQKIWLIILAIIVTAAAACQKKVPEPAVISSRPSPPEEPIQKLAWDAAQKILRGLQYLSPSEPAIHLTTILPGAGVPEEAASYLKGSLGSHLRNSGIKLSETADLNLTGNVFRRNAELVFAFAIYKEQAPFFSDSANIPFDARVENTLAQFEPERPLGHHHEIHKEMPVPSPLAELKEAPLDVSSACPSADDPSSCALLLLYSDRLVERNWKVGSEREARFPAAAEPSRAPSGKIVFVSGSFTVMNNNIAMPLQFDGRLKPIQQEVSQNLPRPQPGRNDFALGDGYFYDFEYLPTKGIVVIDTNYHLNIAEGGKLTTSNDQVGSTLCLSLPTIYTSSASLPGEQDAILKFSYANGSLQLMSSRPMDGDILDLAVTDLNLDGKQELLVTLRNERGIFIEVLEP